jgi:crotonobetainyl-CoA:carnitine CoA-transferase CaiB-like acyl-CoA transferase
MPLTGMTFLSVGDGLAVAYAGRLLALLGAEVVSLRPPKPDAPLVGATCWLAARPVDARLGGSGAEASTESAVTGEMLDRLPVAGALDGEGVFCSPGFPVVQCPDGPGSLFEWAASGAMSLTGDADGPPLEAPGYLGPYLRGAAAAATLLSRILGGDLEVDGASLLGERAAIAGLGRRGLSSCGGASRLLPAADGWVVVSLTRTSDFETLPAWLGRPWRSGPGGGDPWAAVAGYVALHRGADVVDSAQLLGIPAATLAPTAGTAPALAPARASAVGAAGSMDAPDVQAIARQQPWPPAPWRIDDRTPVLGRRQLAGVSAIPPSRRPMRRGRPLIVDFTSLWAGPLCTSLLLEAGARVIKVETASRPDGARRGPTEFFDLMNAGKESFTLTLDHPRSVEVLGGLIDAADIVVESARPRVMEQWGIDVEAAVAARQQLGWISLTGYGRAGPWQHRVAFGDDAAVAAGVVAFGGDGRPRFCADALADPVTGLHAAVAALAVLVGGGSHLVDIALREVAGHLLSGWHDGAGRASAGGRSIPVAQPFSRAPRGKGPAFGASTVVLRAELGLPPLD